MYLTWSVVHRFHQRYPVSDLVDTEVRLKWGVCCPYWAELFPIRPHCLHSRSRRCGKGWSSDACDSLQFSSFSTHIPSLDSVSNAFPSYRHYDHTTIHPFMHLVHEEGRNKYESLDLYQSNTCRSLHALVLS